MYPKIKSYKILSVFLGSSLVLGLLFYVLFHPPAAAAHQRPNTFFEQESLFSHAPSSVTTLQASSAATIYLPIIRKSQVLLYSQDFSSSDNIWPKGDDGDCDSSTSGGRYQLKIDKDKECFRFAPKAAEQIYGEFEVLLYHSEQENNSALGIYINGQGGNNYYLFRIWPNNSCTPTPQNTGGNFEFIRNRNGTKEFFPKDSSGICNANIKRGYSFDRANILKVRHTNDKKITLFINGVQVFQMTEGGSELLGKGTGVYGRAASNKDFIITKYDDYKVYAP
jgi:hypothetical protein